MDRSPFCQQNFHMTQNKYYEKLSERQRGIEAHADQWQAHFRWQSDVKNALHLRQQDAPKERAAAPGIEARLAQRRDGPSSSGNNGAPHFSGMCPA